MNVRVRTRLVRRGHLSDRPQTRVRLSKLPSNRNGGSPGVRDECTLGRVTRHLRAMPRQYSPVAPPDTVSLTRGRVLASSLPAINRAASPRPASLRGRPIPVGTWRETRSDSPFGHNLPTQVVARAIRWVPRRHSKCSVEPPAKAVRPFPEAHFPVQSRRISESEYEST